VDPWKKDFFSDKKIQNHFFFHLNNFLAFQKKIKKLDFEPEQPIKPMNKFWILVALGLIIQGNVFKYGLLCQN
jgi:hypothetical protein